MVAALCCHRLEHLAGEAESVAAIVVDAGFVVNLDGEESLVVAPPSINH